MNLKEGVGKRAAIPEKEDLAGGVKLPGHWHTHKPKMIVVDDAHDLSLQHVMVLKEVTDQGRLQYNHRLGLCLVAAGRGTTIPLKEILDQLETMWVQFRRCMDK